MPPSRQRSTLAAGSELIKSVFEAADTDSASAANAPQSPFRLGALLGSAALVLVLVVGLVAYLVIRRSEQGMATLLAEKGSSLLGVFESALKTGMRGSTGLQLQVLLQEMAQGEDIEFVAVTMPDGVILAHSDYMRIGEVMELEGELLDASRMAALDPADDEKWEILNSEGQRVFLLYRLFNLGQKDWSGDVPEPVIFLGLDVSPFEITNSQNRSYVAMLSVVTLLVGLACLLTLSFAQRAYESRSRQTLAEDKVERLESEIRRNEKLAAVGTMAAGVAHEIRNPLSSIKGYATYFQQRFPEGSDDQAAAGVMVAEVNRLNKVITDLLGLAKPSAVSLRSINVQHVVAHVLRLIRQNALSRNIRLECRIAPKVPPVMADMERLGQALLNLCLNALDAMPGGGTLTIAISGGSRRICMMVIDDGKGIPGDILGKIFDPYFTTKGSGTGLGLPMVHRIIVAHKAHIDVTSRPAPVDQEGNATGHGKTVFRIWLPTAPSDATSGQDA